MKKYFILFLFIIFTIIYKILFGKQFYKNIKLIENPNNFHVLVNKNNKLPAIYIPDDLEKLPNDVSYDNKFLRKKAAIAFIKLSRDASLLGYKIIAVSTYRSYEYQKSLFDSYVLEKGLKYALYCSAKAGHSEHQTGLAVDVMGENLDYNLFEETKEFIFMKDNAHKYGFILRYPKFKKHITGFKYEPWHYRYVGKKLATYLYENNLTLEEYFKKGTN